ncbi:hypothetical protein A0J61_07318 [Choanephora cucurbitarum]|uniref:CCHC-type domain-containing protein n=1 Tax=Choanephora cucurbitarum TaxID=101091 RepID=A0A1C7N6F2_9FUNG|nr:hypothetical protein A0J61_07318 [Choanephora cucurbitarum]
MPTWCCYCHQPNHTKFECEKSKASIICYSCQHFGHQSFECSRKVALPAQKKRKGSSLRRETAEKDYRPSKEVLKSQHAPGASTALKIQHSTNYFDSLPSLDESNSMRGQSYLTEIPEDNEDTKDPDYTMHYATSESDFSKFEDGIVDEESLDFIQDLHILTDAISETQSSFTIALPTPSPSLSLTTLTPT